MGCKMEEEKKVGIGWKRLIGAVKWHFFDHNGLSLCGRWQSVTLEGADYGCNVHPDNCKVCSEKLRKATGQ